MKLNVNPNRMELTKLKRRLVTAARGHKLLKDKQDELMRRFVDLVRYNDTLRKSVEEELISAYKDFVMASCLQPPRFIEEALMYPTERVSLDITTENVMSVIVPRMEFVREQSKGESGLYPYGFYNT
jgi:V/A-type H+-transporting ATPase subunit D